MSEEQRGQHTPLVVRIVDHRRRPVEHHDMGEIHDEKRGGWHRHANQTSWMCYVCLTWPLVEASECPLETGAVPSITLGVDLAPPVGFLGGRDLHILTIHLVFE